MAKRVEDEVRRIEQRVRSVEAVNRLLYRVQVDSLAKAEKLRKMVLSMVSAWKRSRRETPLGSRSRLAIVDLANFAAGLKPFHKPNKRYDALMKQLDAKSKAKRK